MPPPNIAKSFLFLRGSSGGEALCVKRRKLGLVVRHKSPPLLLLDTQIVGPGKKARQQAVVGWFGDRGKEEGEGERKGGGIGLCCRKRRRKRKKQTKTKVDALEFNNRSQMVLKQFLSYYAVLFLIQIRLFRTIYVSNP